jgi:hypothetical protein
VLWLSKGDSNKSSKRKIALKDNLDRRYIAMTTFLIISVVAIAFSTRYLFRSDIEGWTVVQGIFDGEDHSMNARGAALNWAYHTSSVVYGEWEWNIVPLSTGSASIIFIASNLNTNYSSHPTEGYKLEFQHFTDLALRKLTSTNTSDVIVSASFSPILEEYYTVKILRFSNNTFHVFVNDELLLEATDDTYTTSEYLFIEWVGIHTLDWIRVHDSVGGRGWHDFFSGYPSIYSDSFLTKISLFLPFTVLTLIGLYYVFRLFFAQENLGRMIIPFIIAIIIGVGYGYLFNYLREKFPDIEPGPTDTPTGTTISPTGNDTGSEFPTGSNPDPTSYNPSPTGGQTSIGFPKSILSISLMVVAGAFIIATIVFIAIDFFKKREAEFHERVVSKEKRYIPTAASSDHRLRVIRAYHRASYDLIDHGAKSEKDMTPSEFADNAKNQLDVPEKPLGTLTDLYEEARYSEHEILGDKSEDAEQYYKDISDKIKKEKKKSKSESDDENNNDGDN